jgi:hypothetical protein
MTAPLPQWCANAVSSLTRTGTCDIMLMSSLRDASLLAQHLLSRVCSDNIADDVTHLYAALLLQQHPVRTPGCPRFSPAVLPKCCCCVIFNLRRTAHVTDALMCLHWLLVPERIRFTVTVLAEMGKIKSRFDSITI